MNSTIHWTNLFPVDDDYENLLHYLLERNMMQGRIYGEGAGGVHPPPPRDDLRFSNTTGILQKNKNYVVSWC